MIHPTELSGRYGLSDLDPLVERTFWRLFEVAGRHSPSGRLPRLPERVLSARTRVPRTTLRRHLEVLHSQGLVVKSLLDRIVVPLQDAERRFKRAAGSATRTDPDDGNGASATRTVPSPRQLPIVGLAHGPPRADQNGPPRRTPLEPQSPSDTTQDEKGSSTSSAITSVQDLDPRILSDLSDQVGGNVAYALEKLARHRRSWLVFLANPAERRLVVEYGRRDRGRLFALLQQAIDTTEPGSTAQPIKFPGAWLRRLMDQTQATPELAEGVN